MHSILAVDDSASMRQMVSFTLKNAGFNVVEAVDGQDAWEKATARDFDLVLTDQNMPRMDGIGLTRKLRESPKGWLVKPFDPAKLVEVIGKVLR